MDWEVRASIRFYFLNPLTQNSQPHAEVGVQGALQTAVYLYDNWWGLPEGRPVNGSGTSALFCLSCQSPSPAVSYGRQMDFDNARTMRMPSLVLTDHKSDLGRSIISEPDHERGDVILCRHSERPLLRRWWVPTLLAADALGYSVKCNFLIECFYDKIQRGELWSEASLQPGFANSANLLPIFSSIQRVII